MSDYIYIISNELNYVKVGVSKNPKQRVRSLQTGNEHKLTLLFQEEFNCTRKHLLNIEKEIHKQLRVISTHAMGEWFLITADKLESVKNTIIYHRIRFEDDTNYFNKTWR